MPEKYLKLRDEFIKKGESTAEAKTRAAKIYNAQRKPGQKPVTGNYEASMGDVVTRRPRTPLAEAKMMGTRRAPRVHEVGDAALSPLEWQRERRLKAFKSTVQERKSPGLKGKYD